MELWSAERAFVNGRFERDWGVLVDESGVIQEAGPRQELVARSRAAHHYPGRVMMPGVANPNHHGFLRLFRGAADAPVACSELRDKVIWPLSQGIDAELYDAAIRVALAEQALAGVGTVGEFHYLHNGAGQRSGVNFAEMAIQAALDLGMRLTLVYSFFDQGSTESASAFIKPLDDMLDEFHALQRKFAGSPMVSLAPGVHSLEHTSSEAVLAALELADRYDLKLHVQLAQREEDLESARRQYGVAPLRALDKMQALNERAVIVGGALLDDEELDLMKRSGAMSVICPTAALSRGEDFPNLAGLLDHDIAFCLASNGLTMHNGYAPAEEIKWLELSLRGMGKTMNALAERLGDRSLWDLIASLSSRALNRNQHGLSSGAPADLMLIAIAQPCSRPQLQFERQRLLNQILFGWQSQVAVTHVMVQGRMIVKNGTVEADLTDSYRRLGQWSEALLRSVDKALAHSES